MKSVLRLAPLCSALAFAGCLDPQLSDEPPASGLLLPAGSRVPSAHDDVAIDQQIDGNDGVDAEVPLLHAFAGGDAIGYWDFGVVMGFPAPLFVLVRQGAGGEVEPIDHPAIVDLIPGESGYSPFRAVLAVPITDRYDGELMTSFAAVQEAQELGLIEPPTLQPQAINRPVVAAGVTLAGDDAAPPPEPSPLFWKGMTVRSYDFGPFLLGPMARVRAQRRYVLHRQGGEPLSEVARGVDITDDGDRNDTNDIFAVVAGQPGYSPLCQTVAVAVPGAVSAIDTFSDQTMSDIRSATDLFDPDPVAGMVVAYQVTDELRNCIQQLPPEGP